MERIVLRCRRPDPVTGELRDRVLILSNPAGDRLRDLRGRPPDGAFASLRTSTPSKVVQARRRGLDLPLRAGRHGHCAATPGGRSEIAGGSFDEYDLDEKGRLIAG